MSELRQFPRIQTRLEAEITNPSGETCTAIISNISPGGLMLHGDAELKLHLLSAEERDLSLHTIEAHLRCRLPNEPQPFLCRCRLIYIRRLSQNAFDFGLRFIDISEIHAGMIYRMVFGQGPKVVSLDEHRNRNTG